MGRKARIIVEVDERVLMSRGVQAVLSDVESLQEDGSLVGEFLGEWRRRIAGGWEVVEGQS